jgi:2-polyprenyl-3-methyl-5-hydroxy-6-metoxy-1,4-benzoquinol methylase
MITNPIYNEFLELGLIKKNQIKKICNITRDTKIPVYIDSISKIIFLESYLRSNDHYKENASGNPEDLFFVKHGYYLDDKRRFNQFENYLKAADHVLDVGCEWGGFINLAREHCKIISGVELNDSCLKYLKKNFKSANFNNNIENVKYQPDLITSFHVLEHIPDQVETIKKIHRALADNGTLILEVPHAEDFLVQTIDLPEFREFTFWSEHLVLHTKSSLEFILKESGFSEIEVFGYQRYGFTNHLGWLKDKQPNGHEKYSYLEDEKLDTDYKNCRVRTNTSDTLIAVAKK